MFLGLLLATTSIVSNTKTSTAVGMLVPIIALGLPLADTLLAFLRRAVAGRPVFSADREHVHHRLLSAGLNHRQAVIVLYAVCIALGMAGLALSTAKGPKAFLILCAVGLAAGILFNKLGYGAGLVHGLRARPQNRMLRGLAGVVSHGLERATTLDELQRQLEYFFVSLSAESFEVRYGGVTVASSGPENAVGTHTLVMAPLGANSSLRLSVRWTERGHVERDREIAIESIARPLAACIARCIVEHPAAAAA